MMTLKNKIWLGVIACAMPLVSMPVFAQGAVADKWKWLTFLVFGTIIAVTMFVTRSESTRLNSSHST